MRARLLLPALALVVVAAGMSAWFRDAPASRAHIVPGEYSMEVDVAPTQVAMGDTFTAVVGVFHNEPGGFASAQWNMQYDEAIVGFISAARYPSAPPECVQSSNNGTRVLLGCLSFAEDGLSFSGPALQVTFVCQSEGVASFYFDSYQPPAPTTHILRTNGEYLPTHVHEESVECSATAPTQTPSPATPTATPISGPRGGEWLLDVSAPAEVQVGATFVAQLRIFPPDSMGYQGVQWGIVFDSTRLTGVSLEPSPLAPPDCASTQLAGDHLLAGCLTIATNGLTLVATAFEATFRCDSAGSALLDLRPSGGPFQSSVFTGEFGNSFEEQITVNSATVDCVTALPFQGLVPSINGQVPGEGADTLLSNLWLCGDASTDGIDNNGDSTVDNEPPSCQTNGEGVLLVDELVFAPRDCDTRNDDDDDDGDPVSNDPNSPGYRPECLKPTIQDYNLALVDKDGGELPEGLGALEFQIRFDHKIFDISVTGVSDWANGRFVNCSMTVVTENDIRFGCVSTGTAPGLPTADGVRVAQIVIQPEADLVFRLRPTKDNGVVRRLLHENCQIADIYGDIFPSTNAGLTPDCTDGTITVRRLEGDTDMDCDVDITDAQRSAFRYGSFFGHVTYNLDYDLEPWPTADFDIDIKDLQFVFGRDGSTCADPIPDNQDPLAEGGVGQP